MPRPSKEEEMVDCVQRAAWSGTPNVIQQGGGVGVDGLACGPGDNG